MKEYEFIVEMTETLFVNELMAVICSENMYGAAYEGFYEKMFNYYLVQRNRFREASDRKGTEEYITAIRKEWEEENNRIYKTFLDDMGYIIDSPDIKSYVDGKKKAYEEDINSDDRDAVIKKAYKYPYIVREVRKELSKREGEAQ